MAKNDFKAFATDRNANVISQEEWEALPALLSGFTAGKASSAQVNKVIRQASFIAAALAQFVSDKTQRDVLDNGDLPGFVELLGSGFAVEYLSRKNPFGDIKSDGTVQTALENLGLKEAAKREVGTEPGQIPDMSAFTSGPGWVRFPNGTTIQYGSTGFAPGVNNQYVTLPRAFSSNNFRVATVWNDVGVPQSGAAAQVAADIGLGVNTKTTTRFGMWQGGPGGFNVDWIAVGES